MIFLLALPHCFLFQHLSNVNSRMTFCRAAAQSSTVHLKLSPTRTAAHQLASSWFHPRLPVHFSQISQRHFCQKKCPQPADTAEVAQRRQEQTVNLLHHAPALFRSIHFLTRVLLGAAPANPQTREPRAPRSSSSTPRQSFFLERELEKRRVNLPFSSTSPPIKNAQHRLQQHVESLISPAHLFSLVQAKPGRALSYKSTLPARCMPEARSRQKSPSQRETPANAASASHHSFFLFFFFSFAFPHEQSPAPCFLCSSHMFS